MPELHVPKLDDHAEVPHAQPAVRPGSRRKSLYKIALEVVLISTGVFLGLMGEQWREHAHHRELAKASLLRFRTEILKNRAAVVAVREYHVTLKKDLQAYLKSDRPKNLATFDVKFHGVGPVFFEQTTWDLALATQSLAYIDPDLAFALSRAYTAQRGIAGQTAAIVQSTLYGRSWTADFEGYWRQIFAYLGDLEVLEPGLLSAYDDVLPQLDRALGISPAVSSARR